MQTPGVGPHKFYTRRRAWFDKEQDFDRQSDTMGDRQEGSPPRDNRNEDQETREFFRAMVTGQERMAEALQTLTTVVERMNLQDRRNQEQ